MVNDGNDSSDSEGEGVYTSDDDGELSFESDEDGNFTRNLNKMKLNAGEDDDDDEDDEEDENDEEDGDDGEAEEEEGSSEEDDVYVSDSDEESSVENENDEEEEKETATKSRKKPSAVQALKSELNGNSIKTKEQEEDEYKDDTSDEEDIRNTIGNVPLHWYDEYKHIGYDWDANKIIKPARRDQLDDFLKRMEDPNFWRTVKDMQTGQDIVISEADIELIKRINSQRIPDDQYDDYAVSDSFVINGSDVLIEFQFEFFSHGWNGSHRRLNRCQ